MMNTEPVSSETTQVNMRIKGDDLDIIKRAAEIEHRSFSSFMVSVARAMAEEIVERHARTALSESEWKTFIKRLDENPKPLKNLALLLKQKPVWDK